MRHCDAAVPLRRAFELFDAVLETMLRNESSVAGELAAGAVVRSELGVGACSRV